VARAAPERVRRMSARSVILDRVRKAQRTGYVPSVDNSLRTRQPERLADPLTRFCAELTLLGVEHHVETSAEAVRARVAATVANLAVLSWDGNHLPYDAWSVVPGAAHGHSDRDVQAAAGIGVTGCDAAIAETGSLAMLSGAGKPRSASLLPPIHLCIVRLADVRSSMGEFFAERAAAIREAACCYFITGPSRTADIELTLTLGVHGPGRVVIIVGP
jgi:L-lactate dehydrogenase complex protein LldG